MQTDQPSLRYGARLPRLHRLFQDLNTAPSNDARRQTMLNLQELAQALAHDEAQKGRPPATNTVSVVRKRLLNAVLKIEEADLRLPERSLAVTVDKLQGAIDDLMRAIETLRSTEDQR